LDFGFNAGVPLLVIPLLLILLVIFMVVTLPLSIAMRFRASSSRRRAWGWVVSINLFASVLSAIVLLITAAISNAWIPNAFRYVLIGSACGLVLGILGLVSSRWEVTPQALHYTPNRWLILLITLVVTARIFYSFWRAWHAWNAGPADTASWLAASGAAGSMGAGAAILAYYVVYWSGLQRRVRRHRALTRRG
jgi:hypothetical protein